MSQQNAKKELIQFLSNFSNLSDELVQKLAEVIPVITTKKGTILLKAGELQKECYYVLKGLIRQFQFVEGTERTTAFYTETNGTVSSIHYSDQTPSTFFLECMEDCLLICGNVELSDEHIRQFPELLEVTRGILEKDLNESRQTYSNFVLSTPKERYLNFLETRKDLHNRIPLHQIASFLGMTPESLSRIRKRISSR